MTDLCGIIRKFSYTEPQIELFEAVTYYPVSSYCGTNDHQFHFLPARRYASAGYRDRNVSVRLSVRLSVCLSVRHAPVLCQNEES